MVSLHLLLSCALYMMFLGQVSSIFYRSGTMLVKTYQILELLPKHEALEMINKFDPINRGAVSYFYKILNNISVDTTNIRRAWEDELVQQICDETWEEGLKNIHD
ncbi:hypothetical protein ILYODFUR_023978 [Ilyodon furcidens]|uniref:Uncharacterized protein n=1 Tax=Ilyodon furcidens TaxID=33524 RepID=A0ABV0T3D2_9TELE